MHKRYTKNPVGAHYGVRDWLLQRLTAVVMAGYTVFVILAMLLHRPLNYAAWKVVFSEMWFQVGTMLFVASLLYHAWVAGACHTRHTRSPTVYTAITTAVRRCSSQSPVP